MRRSKNIFTLLFALLLGTLSAAAQQDAARLVSGTYENVPARQVLQDLGRSTGIHFYFLDKNIDSLKITTSFRDLPLMKALAQAFANTGLVFSEDNERHIFITRNEVVTADLVEDLFDDAVGKPRKTRAANTVITGDAREKIVDTSGARSAAMVATLENKLYEIGEKPRGGLVPGKVTLAGYLHEATTGEPLSGASILLEGTKIGAVTDQYGYYSLSVPKGRITLSIQNMGSYDTRRQVMVYREGRLNIDLQPKITSLKNVVVSTEKSNIVRNMQMGVQRIDIKTIKQVPVVFGESDILRVVMTLPGVKTVGEASTGLNVRGGSADQNLILFNDATIYNPSHFFGLFSAFNPEIVKDIQLFKSGIPSKYGGRLSSVLEVNSREGNKKEFTGSAGIGILTSRFNLEGPISKEKTSFIVGARTTYANWLLKLLPNEYKRSRAHFYDVNLGITHEINKKNTLYFTGYMSQDQFNLNNDTAYRYGNQNLSLKWKHTFNNKWYSTLSGGMDRYWYNISSEANPVTAYRLSFAVEQYYLKLHTNFYVSPKHTMEFGINNLLYKTDPGKYIPLSDKSLTIPDEMQQEHAMENAVYLSDKFTVSPVFSIEGALRYALYSYLGAQTINNYLPGVPRTESTRTGTSAYESGKLIKSYNSPEIRATMRYIVDANTSIKAGYNRQSQFIHSISNTAAIAPTDIWKLSDPNIKPQSGDQYSLGLYRNFKENTIETSLEVYYKSMKDLLDYKSGAVLILNHHLETDVVSTRAKAYGLELLIKKNTGKINGWFSYTYSRVKLQMNDTTQGALINNGNYYPANYDKPHDATLVGNFRISHRYSVSLNTTYSTGRPITLPIGMFYLNGAQRTIYSDRNEYRIPDYFRMDVSMNIDGNHKVHQRFHNSFTFGVYNLTGKKNPYSVYYTTANNGVVNGYKLSIFGTVIPYLNYNVKF
jgi:hypothetical protein